MKNLFLAAGAAALLAFASVPASSADLSGVGGIAALSLVGGGTLSGSFSNGEVSINRSQTFSGTTDATMQGYGLAESSLNGEFGTDGVGGNIGLNVASGSLSSTGATMNGAGSANLSSSNLSGAGTITAGGGGAIGGGAINY